MCRAGCAAGLKGSPHILLEFLSSHLRSHADRSHRCQLMMARGLILAVASAA